MVASVPLPGWFRGHDVCCVFSCRGSAELMEATLLLETAAVSVEVLHHDADLVVLQFDLHGGRSEIYQAVAAVLVGRTRTGDPS